MNSMINPDTIELLQQRLNYYESMSRVCKSILDDENTSITKACKDNGIDPGMFRRKVLSENCVDKYHLTQDKLIEVSEFLMSPEERIFYDVLYTRTRNSQKVKYLINYPDDFDDTVNAVLDECCVDDRNRDIMISIYFKNETHVSIAARLDISTSRIGQIQSFTLRRMRRSDRLRRMILGDKQYKDKNKLNLEKYLYSNRENKEVDKSCSIDYLGLSNRTDNALRRGKVYTIQQLVDTSDKDLMKLRNFGVKCLVEVHQKLAENGIPKIPVNKEDNTLSDSP